MDVDSPGEGMREYYVSKIDTLQVAVSEKARNLRRLEAQRNALNAKGRLESPKHPRGGASTPPVPLSTLSLPRLWWEGTALLPRAGPAFITSCCTPPERRPLHTRCPAWVAVGERDTVDS